MRTARLIARLLSALLLAASLVSFAVDQPTTPSPVHHKSHKKLPPLVLPPLPAGPLSQLPMDQLPAAPPKVAFQGGLLSISAQNSTLSEILHQVRSLTGASIDLPPNGGNERVVVQLGPGAPRDVLADLLNGTSFNYVMLGSTSDPTAVASVLLTLKPNTSGEVQTASNTPPAYQPPVMPASPASRPPLPFRRQPMGAIAGGQPGAQPASAQEADEADDSDADDKDDKDDDDSDQAQPAQPGQQPGTQPDPNQSDPNQANSGPKDPTQLLEMMRQRTGQTGAGPGGGAFGGPMNPNNQNPPPQQ